MTTPDEHLADLSVAELARRTSAKEVSAVEVVEACLARIAERDPALNAFSVVLADEARAEAAARDRALAEGETPGPLHGVPVAIKEEIDVAGCVTTFGGRANSTPAAVDGEVVRRLRAAGAVIIGKTRMPEFGQWPFTESVDGGYTRNPWKTGHTPGRLERRHRRGRGGGDGARRHRRRRWWIDPDPVGVLRAVRPQAAARSGHHRTDGAPVVVARHGRAADAIGARLRDRLRRHPRQHGHRPVPRRRAGHELHRGGPRRARPAAHRLVHQVADQGRCAPTRPTSRRSRSTAQLLSDLGHEVVEVDPRYPDATLAFVPQFFAGVRTEADAVEHYDRLEKRTRETYRLGSWVRPGVVQWALRAGEKVAAKANRVFEDVDVLLTPTIAHRPRKVGALDKGGTVRAALAAQPMIAYAALWNVTGNPAASVPAGVAADGLPLAVQLVGRQHDETTLLSLSAQLESARPWSMPVLGR